MHTRNTVVVPLAANRSPKRNTSVTPPTANEDSKRNLRVSAEDPPTAKIHVRAAGRKAGRNLQEAPAPQPSVAAKTGTELVVAPTSHALEAEHIPADEARLISKLNKVFHKWNKFDLACACEAGQYLEEAKQLVGHGRFTTWVREHLDITLRSAQNWMRLAKADPQLIAGMTIAVALKALAQPRPARVVKALPAPDTEKGAVSTAAMGEVGEDDNRARGRSDGVDGDETSAREQTQADNRSTAQPAESEAADDAGGEPRATQEANDLEDEAWLETLPLHGQLKDPTIFDRDALLFRRCQPLVQALGDLCQPTTDELRRSADTSGNLPTYRHNLAASIGVTDPSDWVFCPACKGSQRDCHGKGKCLSCAGAGYASARRGRRRA